MLNNMRAHMSKVVIPRQSLLVSVDDAEDRSFCSRGRLSLETRKNASEDRFPEGTKVQFQQLYSLHDRSKGLTPSRAGPITVLQSRLEHGQPDCIASTPNKAT